MKYKLFDSHAHLDDRRFKDDQAEVIDRAWNTGVKRIINVGADISSSRTTLELAKKYNHIYAAIGVHPHSADEYNDEIEKELITMTESDNVVAIGEIGLDYHYDDSPGDVQKKAFRKQVKLAKSVNLPVIIHNREAHADCLEILRQEKNGKLRGVFHCYSGSAEMVREVIELGFYISFAGVITFKNARKAVEALNKVPLDKLLFETDCPYLSPDPKRGKRNEPAYVEYTALKIAHLLDKNPEHLFSVVWDNTHRLFRRLPNNDHMVK